MALTLSLLAGCGDSTTPPPTDAGSDLGPSDAGTPPGDTGGADVVDAPSPAEAAVDAGQGDAGADAGADATDDVPVVVEAGADAGPDMDAGPGMDTGPGMDAGPSMDAGPGPDAATGCTTSMDCAERAGGPVCDVTRGVCVACLAGSDTCGAGRYCATSNTCETGCRDDEACAALAADAGGMATRCNLTSRQCVQCTGDSQCSGLQVCRGGVCAAGCSTERPCGGGQTCCGGACADLSLSPAHCGSCGTTCTSTNGTPFCDNGRCSVTACPAGRADCDRDGSNGCETETASNVEHCGGCGVFCSPRTSARASCSGGMCRYTCTNGTLNCDGDDSNGCETNPDNSPAHCGRCNNACGSGATCRMGFCEPGGLIALYPLDGNGMEVIEALGDAMRMGEVLPVSDRFNRESAAVRLDGTSGFLQAMFNPSLRTGAMPRTLAVWARTSATYTAGAAGTLFDYGSDATRRRFGVAVVPGVGTFQAGGDTLAGTRAVNDNRWHFFAVTYDGTTVRLYVDAMEQGSRSLALDTGAAELSIGRAIAARSTPEFFRGDLDELRIYSRVLTAQEIQGLYTAGGFMP